MKKILPVILTTATSEPCFANSDILSDIFHYTAPSCHTPTFNEADLYREYLDICDQIDDIQIIDWDEIIDAIPVQESSLLIKNNEAEINTILLQNITSAEPVTATHNKPGVCIVKPEVETVAAPKPRLFKCPQCGQTLTTKTHLKRHMHLKHSPDDISVQCPTCLRRFANQVNLDRHRRSGVNNAVSRLRNLCREDLGNVEDTRIRCDLCGQRFHHKSGYTRHCRKMHGGMFNL
ncbi:Zinc finger protein PLAG1 [Folsomia candida]|uniref:Zinc finger protein PLAG1 n=1 Tax=Folsomia candida TaxID=158441 RepID=A0A226DLP4_FOLCA|nr:Zinc finger protein PLAG1 [Folsomia candida]